MADPVWYYARGDVERGPFTLTQIKALANASKLRPDDLVWKEGMENWATAREVPELFPTAGLVGDSSSSSNGSDISVEPKKTSSSTATAASAAGQAELRQVLHRLARIFVWLGVFIVVSGRGCESLSERRADRLNALAELSRAQNPGTANAEVENARRVTLEHRASSFLRGTALYIGIVVLVLGSVGLMYWADRHERWLGVGLVLVVILGLVGGRGS